LSEYLSKPFYKGAIAVFCALLWGTAYPVIKLIYNGMSLQPEDIYARIVLAGARFLTASILIFIIVKFVMRQPVKIPSGKDLLKVLLLGLLLTTFQYFFFYNGLAHTTGSKAAVITSADVFLIILLAHFIYRDDRMNLRKIIGLVLGFLGIILVNWSKGGLNFDFTFTGEGFLILQTIVSALGILYTKKLSQTIHPFLLTAWQMLFGSVLLLGFGVVGFKPQRITLPFEVWILFFYSAVLSAIAFSLWSLLMKHAKAGEISIFKFITPVSGVALSILFIPGEVFGIYLVISLVFVSLGIAAVHYTRGRTPSGNTLEQ